MAINSHSPIEQVIGSVHLKISTKSRFMTASGNWEVYIIQTQSGKLYTGITNNLERRFGEHQQRGKRARFFHFSIPEKIVFREAHPNRSQALKRESAIKKMSLKEKRALVASKSDTC